MSAVIFLAAKTSKLDKFVTHLRRLILLIISVGADRPDGRTWSRGLLFLPSRI